jgi:GNAT superfamily N-acetyltransferase
MTGTPRVRPARPDDVPVVLSLIQELADYERLPDLHSALFDEAPAAYCHVGEVDGAVVGFALWFLNFSTWLGRSGIYLEDLFVRPSARGTGLGRALLTTLVDIAQERGYGRVEWSVLDWNVDAQGFSRSIGAVPMDGWTVWRLDPRAADG